VQHICLERITDVGGGNVIVLRHFVSVPRRLLSVVCVQHC